jgi:predicted PurR-regulated permease PerM
MVDNFLKPILIGQGAQLPVILLLFSLLGGLAAYGLIGLFIGPVILGLLLTALEIYEQDYLADESSS